VLSTPSRCPSGRQVILDDQLRPGGVEGVVPAEELHVVCAHVVVIILLEAQAELGGAGFVDVGVGGSAEYGVIKFDNRRTAPSRQSGSALTWSAGYALRACWARDNAS